jgi:Domain of unknown function (DUF4440)
MIKTRAAVALAIGLLLAPSWQAQENWRYTCIQRCNAQPELGDPEVQRQEIVSLEKEAARAIQLGNATFFRRIYSDEFEGALSHGQKIKKEQWLAAVQSTLVKRESFVASDIQVRIFQDTAVATCLWSSRFILNGQRLGNQFRAMHVYLNTPNGWHVIYGQATGLPPDVQQVL